MLGELSRARAPPPFLCRFDAARPAGGRDAGTKWDRETAGKKGTRYPGIDLSELPCELESNSVSEPRPSPARTQCRNYIDCAATFLRGVFAGLAAAQEAVCAATSPALF